MRAAALFKYVSRASASRVYHAFCNLYYLFLAYKCSRINLELNGFELRISVAQSVIDGFNANVICMPHKGVKLYNF